MDDELLPTGSIRGTLRRAGGRPIGDRTVELWRGGEVAGLYVTVTGNSVQGVAITEPDGSWHVSGMFPVDYRVSYADPARVFQQDGAAVTVPPGGTATVTDTWRSGAAAAVAGFCVRTSGSNRDYCTPGSHVTVAGLAAGAVTLAVTPAKNSDHVAVAGVPVTVADGGRADMTVPLTLGGRINTLVVDRMTGEPVHNECIVLVAPGSGGTGEVARDCTNRQGKVTTRAKPAGPHQMFVVAPGGYGAQWTTRPAAPATSGRRPGSS